jgi:ABC-type Co2+ transport system permease subunit
MLWAVHISNNVLTPSWEWGGFALAAILLGISAWRLHADEIPRISLLTAAFYIGSSIHVPIPLTSVHLVLNALVGVVLGWRSALAIFVGLLFQTVLLSHGGYLALGVNTCVITPPALFAWLMFRLLHRVRWLRYPAARAMLVAGSAAMWLLGGVAAVSLLWFGFRGAVSLKEAAEDTLWVLMHPAVLATTLALGAVAAWVERWLEAAPEFPAGLAIGVATVMLTVAGSCVVLVAGGASVDPTPPMVLAVIYMPVAAIEGVVLGFIVGFLAKVKPELLGIAIQTTGNTSSNVTSH